MGRRPGQGSGAAGRGDLVPADPQWAEPRRMGKAAIPRMVSDKPLPSSDPQFTHLEHGAGRTGWALFPKPPLSWEEDGEQGPRSEHRSIGSFPFTCHSQWEEQVSWNCWSPSPISKAGGPRSSLGLNGTCRMGGGSLDGSTRFLDTWAAEPSPTRVAMNERQAPPSFGCPAAVWT